MQYAIHPDNALERMALWAHAVPVPAIDVLVPLLKARAIMAGVRLGIFEALARGPCSAGELATRLNLDEECVGLLLRVLVSSKYLKRSGQRFALTALARRTLLADSPDSLVAYVQFNYEQWHYVEVLEQTLTTGHGFDFHGTLPESSPAWEHYQRAMLELARPLAKFFAARVPVPDGARRLLDLGGSHGLIGAALCRAHPPLRSTVLELAPAVEPARRLAEGEGISDVVEHRAGDAMQSDYGGNYDVVLLCQLLHHFTEQEAALVLSRAVQSLNPGGTVAVFETERPAFDSAPELATDALALYFRVTSSGQGLQPPALVRELEALGCESIRTIRSLRTPGRVLIHARRAR